MMREKRKWGVCIAVGVLAILMIILVVINIKNREFWSASIIDILTIILGICIMFYLTEHLTDKRRKIDCIYEIVQILQEEIITNENLYLIGDETLLLQQSCANRIKYLKEYSFPELYDDITFIEEQFQEIRELYSNHSKNETELDSIRKDINRHRTNISDKCYKIRMKLFEL